MSIDAARRLADRANRREAMAGTLPLEAQLRLRRLAWLDRIEAMRELQPVYGYRKGKDGVYTRRDVDPLPPEQTGLTQKMEEQP